MPRGLSIVVRAKGTKDWRYEFRLNGKKDKYSYGNYPEISLDSARKLHAIARELVELGRHPSELLDYNEVKQLVIAGAGIKDIGLCRKFYRKPGNACFGGKAILLKP